MTARVPVVGPATIGAVSATADDARADRAEERAILGQAALLADGLHSDGDLLGPLLGVERGGLGVEIAMLAVVAIAELDLPDSLPIGALRVVGHPETVHGRQGMVLHDDTRPAAVDKLIRDVVDCPAELRLGGPGAGERNQRILLEETIAHREELAGRGRDDLVRESGNRVAKRALRDVEVVQHGRIDLGLG